MAAVYTMDVSYAAIQKDRMHLCSYIFQVLQHPDINVFLEYCLSLQVYTYKCSYFRWSGHLCACCPSIRSKVADSINAQILQFDVLCGSLTVVLILNVSLCDYFRRLATL